MTFDNGKIDRGDWFQTYTGKQFYPMDPRPEDINIVDIAHALSLTCRFSGHCAEFYSVAQHSVLVASLCSKENALYGLLHDASEAYLTDMPRPMKHGTDFGKLYKEAEARAMRAICDKFGLPHEEPAEIKQHDQTLLFTEQRDLMSRAPKAWKDQVPPLERTLKPWSPQTAEQHFLAMYSSLDLEKDLNDIGLVWGK
jgi:hypothetical protein